MNPRHAAALALVGWYLMVPPFKPNSMPQPSFTLPSLEARVLNIDAPLSKWEIYVASDSADECEADKTETVKLLNQKNKIPLVCAASLVALTIQAWLSKYA